MKIENNISSFDLILTKKGSVDNIIQFIFDNNLSGVSDDQTSKEIDIYSNNLFSQNLLFAKKVVATKNREIMVSNGEFNSDFNNDFNIT